MTLRGRVALALFVPAFALQGATHAWAADSTWGTGGNAYTTNTGVGWYYSAEQRAFFKTPASFSPASNAPELEWSYVPTCDGNTPGGDSDACSAALCTAPGGEPGVTFWVFSRPVSDPAAGWSLTGDRCIPGERRVDLADIEAEVRRLIEDKFREIARPAVHLAPATGGLVHLPVLAWTDDPGDVTLSIEQPLPGEVRASPTYRWEWSNGSVSTGPGMPYSADVSPTDAPDHYVHAVFSDRGRGSVSLTVTWTGAVTVPGLPAVDIAPLVYTAPASFEVREARAQLVDSTS